MTHDTHRVRRHYKPNNVWKREKERERDSLTPLPASALSRHNVGWKRERERERERERDADPIRWKRAYLYTWKPSFGQFSCGIEWGSGWYVLSVSGINCVKNLTGDESQNKHPLQMDIVGCDNSHKKFRTKRDVCKHVEGIFMQVIMFILWRW